MRYLFAAVLALLLAAVPGGAQTLPCGRGPLRTGDSAIEIRFLPAPVEHVRASVLRALPALAARLTKEKDGVIEAKVDTSLSGSASAVDAQSRGTFYIEITPAKHGGVTGGVLRIDSSGAGNFATPLADEVVCLVSLLSAVDPSSNPRGQTSVSPPASAREVSVPAKTGFKIALRNYLYSKDLAANASAEPALEVIEDVAVDGVTVFRKGALARGKVTGVTTAKSFAHGGSLQFSLESATAVDGQEIGIEGGSLKAQGQYKPGVVQREVSDAVVLGGPAGALLAGLMVKGYEALIPAGTTFEVLVAHPVTVKVEPEPGKLAGSSQTGPTSSQQAGAVKSVSSPGLNVNGTWYWSRWGEVGLFQAAGEREVIGRGVGYDIDGVVSETGVVLHFTDRGTLEYTAELTPKGDGNTLSGRYWGGQMRADSKTKPMEMSKVLNRRPPAGAAAPPPGLNVDGAWYSHDWGKIRLTQAAGQREVIGTCCRGYDIDGFVSGRRVVLYLTYKHKLDYSVELTPKGDDTLSGRYATGQMLGNSETLPFEMTRHK